MQLPKDEKNSQLIFSIFRLFAHDVIAVAQIAAGGQEVIFLHRNQ